MYSPTNRAGDFSNGGLGAHYLAVGSPYTNVGTTGINPTLATALAQMTTFPPVHSTTNFSANTTLSPQAQRDTDIPDLGFHYVPLDFVWNNLQVASGVTLTLSNGVAVGTGAYGLYMNGNLVSQGTPLNLNFFGSCACVQEQPVTPCPMTPLLANGISNGAWQSVYLRFSDLPVLGGTGYYVKVSDRASQQITAGPLTLQDCQLHGGQVSIALGNFSDESGDESSLNLSLKNNLLDRCAISLQDVPYGDAACFNVSCCNNLFHDGSLSGTYVMDNWGSTWSFYDNLFENLGGLGYDLTDNYDPPSQWLYCVTSGNNGYINTTADT